MIPAAVSQHLEFQLLSCLVDIRYQDTALRQPFAYMAGHARQPFPIRKTLRYEVTGTSPYDIREEGDDFDRVTTTSDVLHLIYRRVYRRVLERYTLAGWVALHAALATVAGRRTLILGDKGAGKTTLATRLLYSGHAVEGDELVLMRNGQAVALPRSFHLKPGAASQIPELAGRIEQLPKMYTSDIGISALDPSQMGFDWSITVAPVDRVIWIRSNHGGQTTLLRQPSFEAVRHILQSALIWDGNRQALVAMAARLGGGGGWELLLGDPDSAVALLDSSG